MITARPTEHLTGIIIEGEYEDFDELVDGIYRMTGLVEDYGDLYWSVKNRLLGLCYDIRHALVNEGYADDIPREKDDCANHHHDTVFAVFDCLRYISIKGSCCRTIGGPYGNTTGFTWNRNGIHIVYPDSGDKER